MVLVNETFDRRAVIKGAAAWLFQTFDPEILFDGPAGTGKTFSVIRRCDQLARKYPDCRILWVRETLQSLRQSVQQIYEEHVLWPGHPCLRKGGDRGQRTSYVYDNGSEIVLAGLDTPERLMSTEYDVVVVFEATNPHVTEKAWNFLLTRARGMHIPHPHCRYPDGLLPDGTTTRDAMRFGRYPLGVDEDGHTLFFNQLIADCNPDAKTHWLWRRFEAGNMIRLRSKHEDNPVIMKSYLEQLRSLPGVYYDRLYLGEWVAAEGAIWGTYNAKRHLVSIEWFMEPLTGRRFITVHDWTDDKGTPAQFAVVSVVAGIDFGWAKPGSIIVIAHTSGGRSFVVAQVYAVQKGLEWWADQVEALVDEFKIEVIRCDHDHNAVEILNKRLGPRSGREIGGICHFANKKRRRTGSKVGDMGGLDVVREAFRTNRLFINRNGLRDRDPLLTSLHLPVCLQEEIPAYVVDRDPKTNEPKEVPPDNSIDHACDGLRYGYMDIFERTWKEPGEARFVAPEGVVAYHVGTPEERARLRQLEKRRRDRNRLTWN